MATSKKNTGAPARKASARAKSAAAAKKGAPAKKALRQAQGEREAAPGERQAAPGVRKVAPALTAPSRPRRAAALAPIAPITIEVTGRVLDNEAARTLPSIFQTVATRGGPAPVSDPFFIEPHLKVAKAIDLRAVPSRDARGGEQKKEQLDILPGQFVAIESDDGLVLFTSGARLAEIIGERMPSAAVPGLS